MSLLSDFLPGSALGLALAADVLTFSKANAQLLVASTDASAGGSTFPRIVARNAYQAAGSGGELHFESRNTTPANFVAAKVKGSLSTLTAGAEVGQLELTAYDLSAHRGVRVKGSALQPMTNGVESLGTNTAGFSTLWLYSLGDAVQTYLTAATMSTLYFGGSSLQVRSPAKSYNFVVGVNGAGVFNPVSGNASMLLVGSTTSTTLYSQSAGSTAYGVDVDLGLPSNVTGEGVGMRVALTQANASFTSAALIGLKIMAPTKLGASTITTAYGIYVQPQINATTGIGVYVGASTNFGIVSDGPSNYFGNTVIIRDQTYAGGVTAEAYLDVRASGTTGSIGRFKSYSSSYTETAGLVRIEGADNDSAYNALVVTDTASANTKFAVRGDGAILVNRSTVLNSGLLSLTGRISSAGQDTYDLAASSLSVDFYLQATHSVPVSKIAQLGRFEGTFALGNAGGAGYGHYVSATASSQVGSTSLEALNALASSPGGGTMVGGRLSATATTGFTGNAYGAIVQTTSVGTSASTTGLAVVNSSRSNYGIFLTATAGGDQLDYGVYIDATPKVQTAAFFYQQRSPSTADVLRYVDSSAATRFQIDSNGDIIMGGTGRRIKADFSDATVANRLIFQSTVASGTTLVHAMPASGGTTSGWGVYDGSDPANACRNLFYINTTSAYIGIAKAGSGTTRPFAILMEGQQTFNVNINFDVQIGPGNLTTGATAGHMYAPAVAGTMTGVPTARSGWAPIVIDTTGHKIGIYSGGAWKWTAALT